MGWAPASCLSSIVANGRVARELLVADALLIRRDIAQLRSFAVLAPVLPGGTPSDQQRVRFPEAHDQQTDA
jgi:hypothetical protein